MSSSGNVIDLQKHRAKTGKKKVSPPVKGENAPIVDITEMRQEIIAEERRDVRRTLLTEFIGLSLVVPNRGLTKCSLYDISEKGMAFELTDDLGKLHVGERVAMRVYMNHQTYFPFEVQIRNVQHIKEEGVVRYGGAFQKDAINDIALFHFAKFIENVSTYLRTDHGDVMVSNLGD